MPLGMPGLQITLSLLEQVLDHARSTIVGGALADPRIRVLLATATSLQGSSKHALASCLDAMCANALLKS